MIYQSFAAWVFLFTVAAAPAMADGCADPSSQYDMDACASAGFQKADAALNAVYKQLLAKISPAGKVSLKSAEKSWLAYRDNQCVFNTLGSADGSIHPMMVMNCRTELTLAQTAQLKYQLDCQEGDSSCGDQ